MKPKQGAGKLSIIGKSPHFKHNNPAQVKKLEMFLGSCWLNQVNVLAVLWKENLEIFLATARMVFLNS